MTLFLVSLLTFLGSLGDTNSPSTSSLWGFQSDPCAVLGFGAGSLLLLQLVVAREGSLGAHDKPIGAAVSDIAGLPLRVQVSGLTAAAAGMEVVGRDGGKLRGGAAEWRVY